MPTPDQFGKTDFTGATDDGTISPAVGWAENAPCEQNRFKLKLLYMHALVLQQEGPTTSTTKEAERNFKITSS